MATLDATEANLLALPLALGLINEEPPAPQVGDTIINTLRRAGFEVSEKIGTIDRIDLFRKAYTKEGTFLGRINAGGWTTYVTKHAEPLPYGVF